MLLLRHCLVFFALSGLKSCSAAGTDTCALDFSKDFPQRPPLILNNANEEIVMPQKKGDFKGVIFNRNDKILFSCSGEGNSFEDSSISGDVPFKVLECIGSDTLTAGDKVYHLQNLGCKTRRLASIQKLPDNCASGKAALWQIGFNTTISSSKSIWTPLITTCFDPKQSVTYYSSHTISGKGLSACQDFGNRLNFIDGLKNELYPDFSPEKVYSKKEQVLTLTQLLGSEDLAAQIFIESYLSRGHLAPNADFFYKVTRDATFFYINAAPQWQDINGGIWRVLEEKIRNLAINTQADYNIHTGTHGILSLINTDFKKQQIFLYAQKSELPVPEFYWKVVEDRKFKKGMAFVSHNKLPDDYKFEWPCENICKEEDWDLDASEDEFICCHVNDLKKAIVDMPDVSVTGPLQGVDFSSAHHCEVISIFSILIILCSAFLK